MNNGSINVILEVVDVPNKDPIFVRPFATARFPEKEAQVCDMIFSREFPFEIKIRLIFINFPLKSFEVVAIDGDTGINQPICYSLKFEEAKDCNRFFVITRSCYFNQFAFIADSDKIQIDESTGRIEVKPINRDWEMNEFYPFNVREFTF